MATMAELEQALINADKAGDVVAAQSLANFIQEARKDRVNLIPGTPVTGTVERPPEPSIGEEIIGAGETALSLVTGATSGALGFVGGAIGGLAGEVLSGDFGTPKSQRRVEASALGGAETLTYQPRTQAGQEQTQALGGVLQSTIPLATMPAALGLASAGSRAAIPAAESLIRKGAARIPAKTEAPASGTLGSAGAAGVDVSTVRNMRAESLPVPFKKESALTKGQLSRDYEQLQFEKETAKIGDLGKGLRDRVENQSQTLLANFDTLIEKPGPIRVDPRDIGMGVTKALENKVNVAKQRIKAAYQKAQESGEMASPIDTDTIADSLNSLTKFESVSDNIAPVKKEAIRLGAVTVDDAGNLIPAKMTINDSELLRQFVNDSTDWANPRQARFGKRMTGGIDQATENAGGDVYKKARKLRTNFSKEFENVSLTSRLLANKKNTSQRKIAIEDVFNEVIMKSPIDEINKLRATLLKAGPEGKQAWADLKSKGIDAIKEMALSKSASDSRGTPILSPDKLSRVIAMMDEDGKLQSLYGKKQAQTIRDLGEIAKDIYTAPPGAINTSNTASALLVAMDSLVGFSASGIPVPAITILRESTKYVKNRKTRARINEALGKLSKE